MHGTIGRVSLGVEAIDRYRYIQHLIASDFPPPARILELGSAPGDQIVRLAESGYVCTSVDIGYSSDEWSNGETGRMKRLLDAAGVAGIASDLEMTPYPLSDHSFDAVVMTEVYEHLRDYPIRSLHEVRRVLRRGGRLYFTTPNQAYIVIEIPAPYGSQRSDRPSRMGRWTALRPPCSRVHLRRNPQVDGDSQSQGRAKRIPSLSS